MNAPMSFKEEALLAVSRLPDDVSREALLEEIETLAALRLAEEASAEGRVVSQEEVVRRVRQWTNR